MDSPLRLFLLVLVVTSLCSLLARANVVEEVQDLEQQQASLKPLPSPLNGWDYALAGGLSTAMTDFLLFPIDTIKVAQQTSRTKLSPLGALKNVVSNKGIGGLYKGSMSYCALDGIGCALFFAAYEKTKHEASSRLDPNWQGLSPYLCASCAFITASILIVPGELVKVRMQTNPAGSLFNCIKEIVSTEGGKFDIRRLYTGYTATLFRDLPYFALQMGFFANVRQFLEKFDRSDKIMNTSTKDLCSGTVAGLITGFLTNPGDVITSRMMTQRGQGANGQGAAIYKNIFDCARRVTMEEGSFGLFKGVAARVLWIAPYSAISLYLNEAFKRGLEIRRRYSFGGGASGKGSAARALMPAPKSKSQISSNGRN